jgi:hypothetical protein
MPRTADHPWDRAARLRLTRASLPIPEAQEPIDAGVNYFVLQLERLGARTFFSCEGHPYGFYVVFACDEQLARRIHSLGYFAVELERGPGSNRYSLRLRTVKQPADRPRILRGAAEAWERGLGPLDLPSARRSARQHPPAGDALAA